MYEVSNDLYLEVADHLASVANDGGYFSGSFDVVFGDVECHVILSAIIYHRTLSLPEGREVDVISDVVPVWWEFHTYIDGEEMLNDFSFDRLREYLRN